MLRGRDYRDRYSQAIRPTNLSRGMYSWTASSENMVSDGAENGNNYNTLFDMFLKRQTVKIAFSLQTDNIDYASKLDSEFRLRKERTIHPKTMLTESNMEGTLEIK